MDETHSLGPSSTRVEETSLKQHHFAPKRSGLETLISAQVDYLAIDVEGFEGRVQRAAAVLERLLDQSAEASYRSMVAGWVLECMQSPLTLQVGLLPHQRPAAPPGGRRPRALLAPPGHRPGHPAPPAGGEAEGGGGGEGAPALDASPTGCTVVRAAQGWHQNKQLFHFAGAKRK